jgi:hypothetical protein
LVRPQAWSIRRRRAWGVGRIDANKEKTAKKLWSGVPGQSWDRRRNTSEDAGLTLENVRGRRLRCGKTPSGLSEVSKGVDQQYLLSFLHHLGELSVEKIEVLEGGHLGTPYHGGIGLSSRPGGEESGTAVHCSLGEEADERPCGAVGVHLDRYRWHYVGRGIGRNTGK